MTRRSPVPFVASLACAAASAAVYLVAVYSADGRGVDRAVLRGFRGLLDGQTWRPLSWIASLADPGPVALAGLLLVGGAVFGGRARAGVAAGMLLVGANLSSQILKPLLAAPRPAPVDMYVAPASWPSGHTMGAMSLALALVLVSAPRWRPLAAVAGGTFTMLVVTSILALGWHFPSDVLGGLLICTAWACAAAGIAGVEAEQRAGARGVIASLGIALGVAVAAVVAAGAAFGPASLADYLGQHPTFGVGAAALAAGAVALAFALPYTLGHGPRGRARV